MARSIRGLVDLLADCDRGDLLVSREVEDPIRDLAPHPYRAGRCCRCGGSPAYGGVGVLSDISLEAGFMDRPDNFMDRSAALRAPPQTVVHAAPAVPRFGRTPGARRHLDAGDASGS